jgi:hypothetical protein
MEDSTKFLIGFVVFVLTLTGAFTFDAYSKRAFYQENTESLTEVNKCLYTCNYMFGSCTVYDSYRMCLEKCDRISERVNNGGLK